MVKMVWLMVHLSLIVSLHVSCCRINITSSSLRYYMT